MNRFFMSATLFAIAVGCFVAFLSGAAPQYDKNLQGLARLVDVHAEIVREYVEEPDEEKMIDAAVRAMIDTLDDLHTVYLSPEDIKAFDKHVRGTFSGIGAEVDMKDGQLLIVAPLEDSPAWNAGVMVGDLVLEIDGVPLAEVVEGLGTDNEKLKGAINSLTGKAGTDVRLLVRHESNEEETIVITRAQIDIPTVRGFWRDVEGRWHYLLDDVNRIGYVRLSQFTDTTAEDLQAVLMELKRRRASGLILDLRLNPGGLLEAAVEVSDLFLEDGKSIVSVKGRRVPDRVINSTDNMVLGSIPIVVLANEFSASASEIVTGALLENDRAQFVGTRTFGKGSVQQVNKLKSPGAIKITNAYYYLPNGRNIHRKKDQETWGVDPKDGFYVPMTTDQIKEMLDHRRVGESHPADSRDQQNAGGASTMTPAVIEETRADPQLAAALAAILGKVETGQWPKVGESGADDLARQSERERLSRRRGQLQDAVSRIDGELAKLDSTEDTSTESSDEEHDPAEPEPAESP